MYEEKSKKLNVNWKSLFIKMIILLFAVFIVLWLISLVNKQKNNKPSNFNTNLKLMQTAANEYFNESRLPVSINGTKKITLGEMFESKLLIEFKDQNNKSCDTANSYAEAKKIDEENYNIKVKLVCPEESNYIMDKITIAKNNTNIDNNEINNPNDNNTTIVDNNEVNKPNNSTNSNNNTGDNTTKPNTTKPSNNVSNNTTTTISNTTCNYGNKDYVNYVLSYEIPGNCAVSKSDYNRAEYSNAANSVMAVEYQKLVKEMSSYSNIVVESPSFTGVYNKTNTGLVGYQILFTVRRKNNYALETVYQYYLNKDGSRKVIIDKRNTLNSSSSTSSSSTSNSSNSSSSSNSSNSSSNITSNSVQTKIILNKTSLDLTEGETYTLKATVTPYSSINHNITWSSNNTRVATVSANGVVTAKNTGFATITAKSGNATATAMVIVNTKKISVSKINVSNNDITLNVNESEYLDVSVTPTNATNKTVYYTSSNPSVVKVTSSGKVTALKAGFARIFVEADGKGTTVNVTVNNTKKSTYCKKVVQYDYFMVGEEPNDYTSNALTIQYYKKDMKDVNVYAGGYLFSSSQYEDARKYFNDKERVYSFKNLGTFQYVLPSDYSKYTLKQENFSQTVSQAYKSNGTWNIDITYKVNNYNNATPYYHNASKRNVYFIPLYITIEYTDLGNCVNIPDSESSLYRDYVRI